MTPRLPPELLHHTLELATEGESPAEQQLVRNRFRLVCKEWYNSFDYWKRVAVVGPAAVSQLANKLLVAEWSKPTPARPGLIDIEAAHIDLRIRDMNPRAVGIALTTAVVCLLRCVPLVKELDLIRDPHTVPIGSDDGLLTFATLRNMDQLERFRLESGSQTRRVFYAHPTDEYRR